MKPKGGICYRSSVDPKLRRASSLISSPTNQLGRFGDLRQLCTHGLVSMAPASRHGDARAVERRKK